MKLLVLDRGRLLFHLVERIVPDNVDVIHTPSFREAMHHVESREADVVVAELRHCHVPWPEFQQACCRKEPHIPVLFQSSVQSRVEDTCLRGLCSCHRFISEPYHVDELRAKVFEVLEEARRHRHEASRAAGADLH